jgi:serine/threonine protein kinase
LGFPFHLRKNTQKMTTRQIIAALNATRGSVEDAAHSLKEPSAGPKLNGAWEYLFGDRSPGGAKKRLYDTLTVDPAKLMKHKMLGRGSWGSVYQVFDIDTFQNYALKELWALTDDLDRGPFHDEIVKELVMLSSVNPVRSDGSFENRHVVGYYGASMNWVDGNQLTVPMVLTELIRGVNLRAAMSSIPPLDMWPQARIFARDLFDGLAFIHSKGVAHNDIKPENVMVVTFDEPPYGRIVIVDLGLGCFVEKGLANVARALESETTCKSDKFPGTVTYMAPELLNANATGHRLDDLSRKYAGDVWGAALTLFDFFTRSNVAQKMVGKDKSVVREFANIDSDADDPIWHGFKHTAGVEMMKKHLADTEELDPQMAALADVLSDAFLHHERRPTAKEMLNALEQLE